MWKLKYDTNEFIYEIKTDSQMQRTDLWVSNGRRVGEGWIGSLGLANANYYIQMDKQQGPTVQHKELYLI